MAKRLLVFIAIFLFMVPVFAQSKMAVMPAVGSGSEGTAMAKSLTKELKSA